ncbi:TetR/AcrR family transcriptional regulator [Nocardioides sp.]|uniref:TetR/AcrR family transcriptional regulator n=1 Tax=Nocardioides sp. TaxID=35761 RepID=UPI00261B3E2A|nr:TetR/AcrR family transcriptional regulator [Nocardioides sp.]
MPTDASSSPEQTSTRDRLVAAAFDLFAEQGFENTTVDEIAQRAGVGRSTFFRNFGSKEDAIFPEHDALLARIEERLSTADPETRGLAVAEAARLVLQHYLAEGARARTRYRLTRSVPALQAREVAGLRQYQRLFTRFLARWWADETDGPLRAELMAAAIVTAHNHVLRRWLRGEAETAGETRRGFDHAIDIVLEQPTNDDDSTTVIVMRSGGGVEAVANRLRRALAEVSASQ